MSYRNSTSDYDSFEHRDLPGEVGALHLWWDELNAGKRRVSDFDSLWRAACKEAQARESIRLGLYSAARDDRLAAALIVAQEFGGETL